MSRLLDIFGKWDGLSQGVFLIIVLCLVGGFLYHVFDRVMDLIVEARKYQPPKPHIMRPLSEEDEKAVLEALKEINKKAEGIVRRKD